MNLRDQLQERLPKTAINKLSNHFRIIGDIAIVSIPPEMSDYKQAVSEALISNRRNIKTVLNKISKLDGDRRVASFEVLAGKDTVTVHKELGFSYKLDVCKVFFNSSLSYERRRIALMIEPGEKVLVPFCGVGPFAIPVAARGAKTVAVESNSEACRWLAENIRLNDVEENVAIINGDAFLIPRMIRLSFDRAIIPMPYGRDDILEIVSPVVKKEGWCTSIHLKSVIKFKDSSSYIGARILKSSFIADRAMLPQALADGPLILSDDEVDHRS